MSADNELVFQLQQQYFRIRISELFEEQIAQYKHRCPDEIELSCVLSHILCHMATLAAGEDELVISYMARRIADEFPALAITEYAIRRQVEGIRKREAERSKTKHGAKTLRTQTMQALMLDACEQAEDLIGGWLLRQSLGMVYAKRGVGKTHFSLGLAYAVASGSYYLKWTATVPRKVLYIDGEMPKWAVKQRLVAIATAMGSAGMGNLIVVTPDDQEGPMPDLSTPHGQAIFDALIEQDKPDFIIIDNISCLASRGGDENSAESWNDVADWALKQRAAGRAVLFVHHSGKSGEGQRGTSKREDLLDYVVALKLPEDYEAAEGCRFEVRFEKARHLVGHIVEPFEAQMVLDQIGAQIWYTRPVRSLFDRAEALSEQGFSQRKIAEELGINQKAVSRLLKTNGGTGHDYDD